MAPKEIEALIQQAPALRQAMKDDKERIWQFLRNQVECAGKPLACERCGLRLYPLLQSIYRGLLCIDCLLHEFLVVGPLMADKYRDPRSRDYDAVYDQQCKVWDDLDTVYMPDDYDGPPIVMAEDRRGVE